MSRWHAAPLAGRGKKPRKVRHTDTYIQTHIYSVSRGHAALSADKTGKKGEAHRRLHTDTRNGNHSFYAQSAMAVTPGRYWRTARLLLHESFWWWQFSDRYLISLFPHLHTPFLPSLIIIMYIYHALINALSAHMIHINLNMIFYTYVEHNPPKTIYIKSYKIKNKTKTHYKHTHTHTYPQCL